MALLRVDGDTGEIVVKQPKFSKAMDKGLRQVITDKDVTGLALRCLLYLITRMDYENIARIPQSDIVETLGASRQKVSSALSVLAAKGYVSINTTRRPGFYKISEHVAQRGKKNVSES